MEKLGGPRKLQNVTHGDIIRCRVSGEGSLYTINRYISVARTSGISNFSSREAISPLECTSYVYGALSGVPLCRQRDAGAADVVQALPVIAKRLGLLLEARYIPGKRRNAILSRTTAISTKYSLPEGV